MSSIPPIKKTQEYYNAHGKPADSEAPSIYDKYRFWRISKYLTGKSVLDIGPGRADFLKSIQSKYSIAGIDINMERVNFGNHVLGENAIELGNLDEDLRFADNSFDNVTCTEVLEHTSDPIHGISELVRISKKRIIITVPYREKIHYVICAHCLKLTPATNHQHSFDEENIKAYLPENVRVIKVTILANKLLCLIPYINKIVFKMPYHLTTFIDRIFNLLLPKARWMMVILEK